MTSQDLVKKDEEPTYVRPEEFDCPLLGKKCISWSCNLWDKKNGRCTGSFPVRGDPEPRWLDFFEEMLTKLNRAREKRGDSWRTCSIEDLKGRLVEEFKEWLENGQSNELVDVAKSMYAFVVQIAEEGVM